MKELDVLARETFSRRRAEIAAKSINAYMSIDSGMKIPVSMLEPEEENKVYLRLVEGDVVGQPTFMYEDIVYYLNPEKYPPKAEDKPVEPELITVHGAQSVFLRFPIYRGVSSEGKR